MQSYSTLYCNLNKSKLATQPDDDTEYYPLLVSACQGADSLKPRQVFTTSHDSQKDISILMYQGDASLASKNTLLGQLQVVGLPPHRKGEFKLQVRDQDPIRVHVWQDCTHITTRILAQCSW